MFNSTTSSGEGSGFFSEVASGFGEGLSKIGSDVLPNWAASQLNKQKTDQLAQPTYDPNAANAQQRINDGMKTTAGQPGPGLKLPTDPKLLLIGGGIVVGVIVLLMLRR